MERTELRERILATGSIMAFAQKSGIERKKIYRIIRGQTLKSEDITALRDALNLTPNEVGRILLGLPGFDEEGPIPELADDTVSKESEEQRAKEHGLWVWLKRKLGR